VRDIGEYEAGENEPLKRGDFGDGDAVSPTLAMGLNAKFCDCSGRDRLSDLVCGFVNSPWGKFAVDGNVGGSAELAPTAGFPELATSCEAMYNGFLTSYPMIQVSPIKFLDAGPRVSGRFPQNQQGISSPVACSMDLARDRDGSQDKSILNSSTSFCERVVFFSCFVMRFDVQNSNYTRRRVCACGAVDGWCNRYLLVGKAISSVDSTSIGSLETDCFWMFWFTHIERFQVSTCQAV
jgi:hypothetical protein